VTQDFIDHLSTQERAGRAHLRRVLQDRELLVKPPPEAMRIVERYVLSNDPLSPRYQAHYLIAGLYALCHPDPFDSPTSGKPFAEVAATLTFTRKDFDPTKVSSLEQRFLTLLDCERQELPYPLRQWVQLIKAASLEVDWSRLLLDMSDWGDDQRDKWGRRYYRTLHRSQKNTVEDPSHSKEETQ
jgi:CRISPR type I-E-associated protein CasB/Cse2